MAVQAEPDHRSAPMLGPLIDVPTTVGFPHPSTAIRAVFPYRENWYTGLARPCQSGSSHDHCTGQLASALPARSRTRPRAACRTLGTAGSPTVFTVSVCPSSDSAATCSTGDPSASASANVSAVTEPGSMGSEKVTTMASLAQTSVLPS